jgi:hypothetical protein
MKTGKIANNTNRVASDTVSVAYNFRNIMQEICNFQYELVGSGTIFQISLAIFEILRSFRELANLN